MSINCGGERFYRARPSDFILLVIVIYSYMNINMPSPFQAIIPATVLAYRVT